MAQIPLGNFGGAQPQETGPTPINPAAFDHHSATETLGEAGMATAQTMQQDVQVRQRAAAALTLAKTTNDLGDIHDQIARGVADGSIPADQAQATLKEQSDKVMQPALDAMSPFQRMQVQTALVSTTGQLDRSLQGVIAKRRQSETATVIDSYGEQVQRQAAQLGPKWASDKYGAMVDFTGGAAGWTPEQMAVKKQAFTENTHFDFFDEAGVQALERGDINGLKAVQTNLNGPAGDALDPAKRAALGHRLFAYQSSLEAKQARDQNAAAEADRLRLNTATDLYNQATDLVTKGQYLSPDFIQQVSDASAGTPLAPAVQHLMGAQTAIAGFATQTAAQRNAVIESERSRAATPGVGTNPDNAKAVEAMVKIDTAARAAAKDNPWQAAESYGVIQHAPQIDATNLTDALPIIASRMKDIGKVENWVGTKVSPLQPEEAEQISKGLRSLPPDQAASLLSSMGGVVKDADRIAAIAKQVGDKDGTMGLAMGYAGDQTNSGRLVAELILRGDRAIKDKAVLVDESKQTGWKAEIAKQINDAYPNPQIAEAAKDAAFKIAAARSAMGNGEDLDIAIKLATGGIIDHGQGRIPVPYGMQTAGDFDKALKLITPDTLAPQVPNSMVVAGRAMIPLSTFVASLPDATLVHAGQGLYNVRAGNALVTNTDGKRITLQVKP